MQSVAIITVASWVDEVPFPSRLGYSPGKFELNETP